MFTSKQTSAAWAPENGHSLLYDSKVFVIQVDLHIPVGRARLIGRRTVCEHCRLGQHVKTL